MQITHDTPLKAILEARPDSLDIFLKHGVDVPLECDESLHDCELSVCETMCHIDDIEGLISDLQQLFDTQTA